ncbi:Pkinase-domain-containing protein [Coniophora puteana RWD-64-598 SS2]|uniref:Pkinase-domain-containing protein n=1 Tax=Coniophora puteana (strain RWD-64-598) TaxID=741705 RepID=A0A5M3N7G8_CONPW|nr:Pkinase-domain-containing protein [Coniophora puteana RWD-64-598 SS2]EIW86801.1 Pkinase-domain-containing protein [Coniophora puteana RWD-64-598 SS2]
MQEHRIKPESPISPTGSGLWIVKPQPLSPGGNRPKLAVSTASDESRTLGPLNNYPPIPTVLPPHYPPQPRPPRRHIKNDHRSGIFEDENRPNPEELYERLEDAFPSHDLDKPVIEANSGGTSPTAAEDPMTIGRGIDGLARGKKSIRYVAEEHKRRIDRTSRADAASFNVMRKRSTKLWGSRVEEVTTDARHHLSRVHPDSPSGGPRPIFKWVRGELIGKGTYGRVYLALNVTTGDMIAVKQVEMPRSQSERNDSRQTNLVQALKMESETLKDLDHPNIVTYLGFEETPDFLSIFLEYVPGGSVGSCLREYGKFGEDVTKSFTAQILAGLEYLHSKNILHRDLKADNILVENNGTCKISDFGISKRTTELNGAAHTAMQGTVFWMAPEVISARAGLRGYNSKADIWSVGCVVYEMLTGKRPWSDYEEVAVMLRLYQQPESPPLPADFVLSDLGNDFKERCFAVDPDKRATAAELREHRYLALPEDWFFTDFCK